MDKSDEKKCITSLSYTDPIMSLAPLYGIQHHKVKREFRKIPYVYNQETTAYFTGPFPLTLFELRLLLALCALACVDRGNGLYVLLGNDMDVVRDGLQLKGHPKDTATLKVVTSVRELAREMNLSYNGSFSTQVKEALSILRSCGADIETKDGTFGSNLLSYKISNTGLREMQVVLNPDITSAICGIGASRVIYSMCEVRRLKSPAAYFIYSRLCAILNPNSKSSKKELRSREFKITTLMTYVWPNQENISSSLFAKRVKKIAEAMNELVLIGWEVQESGKGKNKKYKVSRTLDV